MIPLGPREIHLKINQKYKHESGILWVQVKIIEDVEQKLQKSQK